MFKLREYQQRAIDLTVERFKAGDKRVLNFMMTGGGKGLLMSEYNRMTVFKGRRVLNIMRRKSIVTQTADNYKKYHGLESSIIMQKHKTFDQNKLIQVASIDTLSRRLDKLEWLKQFDLFIVDECHDCTSPSYKQTLNWIGDKHVIGLTATPFPVGRKVHDFWQSCVKPIEAHELRDKGFLVPEKVYVPKILDFSKIKKLSGDFHQGQLFEEMSNLSVIGDIVKTYKEKGEGKKAILFAVNIRHSKILAEAFRREGIPAAHYDQEHTDEERKKGISDLRKGKIKVLTNVNIFSTGVDLPFAEVGILARPTMSEILDIQQRGRLLRPYKICSYCSTEFGGEKACPNCGGVELKYEKKHAIFLDHANNFDRNGMTYAVRQPALVAEDLKKRSKKGDGKLELSLKRCPECGLFIERKDKECPDCSYEFITKERIISEESGDLVLLSEELAEKKLKEKILNRYGFWSKMNRDGKIRHDQIFYRLFREFKDDAFKFVKFPNNIEKSIRKQMIMQNSQKVFK